MVKTTTGDLFSSQAQTLVNTVNCVGVMGKGVALAFKERFPDMYKEYVRLCKAKRVHLGEPYLYRQLTGPWILNFPTKDHWRSVSRLSDIVAGLEYLEQHCAEWGIQSLAVPPLGCGNGGLEWRIVGPTLYRHLNRLGIPVELYAPHGTTPFELTAEFLGSEPKPVGASSGQAPTRVPAAALALVEVLARVLSEPYHWPIGRITFQKIAYFATEAGLPTGLTFSKGSYGPFSADLKALLSKLINNGLIEERPLGQRMLAVYPGKTFADARKAFEVELREWNDSIEHVADLFMRMRTQQAEIAASVLFMARNIPRPNQEALTELDVFRGVLDWKIKRRPPLKPEDVAQTVRNLNILRWVHLKPSELPIPAEAWC
jgi:O-acetyl-ADP-ribose deacetylase (regulator of RNase III)